MTITFSLYCVREKKIKSRFDITLVDITEYRRSILENKTQLGDEKNYFLSYLLVERKVGIRDYILLNKQKFQEPTSLLLESFGKSSIILHSS
jgi:hypothetical protein